MVYKATHKQPDCQIYINYLQLDTTTSWSDNIHLHIVIFTHIGIFTYRIYFIRITLLYIFIRKFMKVDVRFSPNSFIGETLVHCSKLGPFSHRRFGEFV